VEEGRAVIVGVNRFTVEEPPLKDILRISPEAVRRQIERLQEVRRRRDSARVQRLLARLEEVARSEENTMPVILECVEAYCTIGEICDVFRKVFGEYKPETF